MNKDQCIGYELGHKAATRTYSEGDMRKAIEMTLRSFTTDYQSHKPLNIHEYQNSIILSLNKTTYPTKVIAEVEYLSNEGVWKNVLLPSEWQTDTKIRLKTITNPNNQKVLVGKYILNQN